MATDLYEGNLSSPEEVRILSGPDPDFIWRAAKHANNSDFNFQVTFITPEGEWKELEIVGVRHIDKPDDVPMCLRCNKAMLWAHTVVFTCAVCDSIRFIDWLEIYTRDNQWVIEYEAYMCTGIARRTVE